ncbi:CP2 transcription factor-domain-containing protein [Syncephalastrum racemosum]|uniref:CP2 transcription factor-domain-containing protein n=1 Tax=Syncephalastrum racemosum TaxID=13706 RepID=A0A1X2HVZ0_SYNRA|nr:CP2 transcription factor-domain-containing protein [Syncephalastrum racemosum]
MFHDESHRKVAPNYWKFWLSQQKNQHSARALDIGNISLFLTPDIIILSYVSPFTDANRSNGIHNVECNYFDRVSFQWNGKLGANIYIRFNCLSTDFSRIKGVKGIPLRLHMESHLPSDTPGIEKSYCRIKLFRDKGAERKNKDDAKHIEKQLEKLRGKNGETHPFWLAYSQTAPYTVFCDVPSSPIAPPTTLSDIEYARRLSDSSSSTASRDHHHPHHSMMYGAHLQPQPPPPHAAHSAVTGMMLPPVYSPSKIATKRPYPVHAYHHHQTPTSLISPPADPSMATAAAAAAAVAAASSAANGIHDAATATPGPPPYYPMPPSAMHLDMDPTYVPQRRRRIAKLCIFAKFPTETHHRAVYLEQLTLQDLKVKLLDKMMKPDQDIKEIVRYVANKENVVVHVDDTFIQDIPEEQDMEVDLHANDDGSYTLALRY